MNLAKVLKQKRDAEARQRNEISVISYTVDGTGNTSIPVGNIQTTPYTLPQATASALGGIKAAEKTTSETQEVKIDTSTGKLYVASGGGGSGVFDEGLITDATSTIEDDGGLT